MLGRGKGNSRWQEEQLDGTGRGVTAPATNVETMAQPVTLTQCPMDHLWDTDGMF